jgi:hypothetical protein
MTRSALQREGCSAVLHQILTPALGPEGCPMNPHRSIIPHRLSHLSNIRILIQADYISLKEVVPM